jgi:hypothetical protein
LSAPCISRGVRVSRTGYGAAGPICAAEATQLARAAGHGCGYACGRCCATRTRASVRLGSGIWPDVRADTARPLRAFCFTCYTALFLHVRGPYFTRTRLLIRIHRARNRRAETTPWVSTPLSRVPAQALVPLVSLGRGVVTVTRDSPLGISRQPPWYLATAPLVSRDSPLGISRPAAVSRPLSRVCRRASH